MDVVLPDRHAHQQLVAGGDDDRAAGDIGLPAAAVEILQRVADIRVAAGQRGACIGRRQARAAQFQAHRDTGAAGDGEHGVGRGLVDEHAVDRDGVLSPFDGDGQDCDIRQPVAGAVGDGVVEAFGQRLAGAQCLDGGVAVIEGVRPATIGSQRQRPIQAGQWRAECAGCAAAFCAAHAHGRHAQFAARVIHVGDRIQHVAAWVVARSAIVDAASFDCRGDGVRSHRRIVGATDGDGQGGGVLQTSAVGGSQAVLDGVDEGFRQRGAGVPQGLHGGVAVVDDIGVAAVGAKGQGAVEADQLGVGPDGGARATACGACRDDTIAAAGRSVVGEQIAARVGTDGAIGDAARFGGRRNIVHCIGIIGTRAEHRDVQGRATGCTTGVACRVSELLDA